MRVEMTDIEEQGILVVGAGYPRSGTSTLQGALDNLGLNCYHMTKAKSRGDFVNWAAAAKMTPDLRAMNGVWNDLLSDFKACVDTPTVLYWSEIKNYFESTTGQKVVVILTERDSPEQWYNSMKKTVIPSFKAAMTMTNWLLQIHPGSSSLAHFLFATGWFGGKMDDEDHCKKLYIQHNEYVKKTVPEKDLLVLNVAKHGYSDLIAFLEKHDIPLTHADRYRHQTHFEVTNKADHFVGQSFIDKVVWIERLFISLLLIATFAAVFIICYFQVKG